MKSRYDYMKESKVLDIDGEPYPDPLSINYQAAVESLASFPQSITFNNADMKKLWVKYYKETGKVEEDDILYSINGVEHVGVLEPGDVIYKFPTDAVSQFSFKDLD